MDVTVEYSVKTSMEDGNHNNNSYLPKNIVVWRALDVELPNPLWFLVFTLVKVAVVTGNWSLLKVFEDFLKILEGFWCLVKFSEVLY
jgi:hypothetical protein